MGESIGDGRLIGRDRAVDQLSAAVASVARGEHRFVVVEGHAGVGKSAVVWAGLHAAQHWPRKYASLVPTDLHELGSAACKLIPGMTPELAADVPVAVDFALSVLGTFDEPTVIILENGQWIDAISTEIMSGILPYLSNYPVLFIGTTRPSLEDPAKRLIHAALAPATTSYIGLAPLTVDESRDLLATHLGVPLSPALAHRLHRITGGLPLLVEDVARLLQGNRHDASAVAEVFDVFAARSSRRVRDFDATVADALTYLTPVGRHVVETLAVSPVVLTPAQLRAACGVERLDQRELIALQEADFIRWDAPQRGFRIALEPIAQAVRQWGMAQDEAVQGVLAAIAPHPAAEVMRFLEGPATAGGVTTIPSAVAEQALSLLERRVLDPLMELLQDLVRTHPDDAVLSLVLAVCWDEPRESFRGTIRYAMRATRSPFLASVARALESFTNARYEAAISYLLAAGDSKPDHPAAAYAYLRAVDRIARTDAVRGTLHLSHELRRLASAQLRRLEEELRASDQTDLDGYVTQPRLGALRASLRLWEELAELGPELGHVRPGEFADLSRRLVKRLEAAPHIEDDVLAVRVFTAARARDFGDRSSVAAILAHRPVLENGTEELVADAYGQLALTYFDAGQFDGAQRFAELAREQAFGTGNAELLLTMVALDALVPGTQYGVAAVKRTLSTAERDPEVRWYPFVNLATAYVRAWAATADGDHEEVVASLLPVSDNVLGWQPLGMAALTLLARSQYYAGGTSVATDSLGLLHNHRVAATEAVTAFVTAYLRALSTATDDPQAAARHYSMALGASAEIPNIVTEQPDGRGGGLRIYRALAAYDFGRLIVESGTALQAYASEALRGVLCADQLWISCHATTLRAGNSALIGRLRELAVHSTSLDEPSESNGVVADAPQGSSADLTVLSRREREIGTLIGRGLMNREIADRLVISVRTAEYHAANIAKKLRVDSRAEVRQIFSGGRRR
ncbi:LuxR C-terminal-related transcriptional regulator [Zhihengliuella flava]|uniref:DNA-binding CsgD family transcriptional regulator/tetratricopeptide (TPR) repeat protein n=1 Tax=Zhihengliuella flava TaxID=1285193 RepID=A0A931DDE7_9MICC|nr:AAA family ATPase [Zhihengliuella flava]MBG6085421.1 DNA-binding CsgD family transcriptional regulator/tetratricopeptide (TPR) repeat protein [Zhihengliuella flava]